MSTPDEPVMHTRFVTPGYDGPEGTEFGDEYAPGKATPEEYACGTCSKVHKPTDGEHSEDLA